MSKRRVTNNKTANPKDFWKTPVSASTPLIEALPPGTEFEEPCAGDGGLAMDFVRGGHLCTYMADTHPRDEFVDEGNALARTTDTAVITNPPYRWVLLQPLLDHWIGRVESWLLLPSDMAFNHRTNPYFQHVDQILPIGRVKWMGEDSPHAGMENFAWFHFSVGTHAVILPRAATKRRKRRT